MSETFTPTRLHSDNEILSEQPSELKRVVTRFQEKCPTCNRVAMVKEQSIVSTSTGKRKVTQLTCGHFVFQDAQSISKFEEIVFDGIPFCKHVWGTGKERTICQLCKARRLYEYQVKGAQFLEEANGRGALFDEQGLGKTLQALAYMYFHRKRYLWVTKSGIKFQHLKEIIRILGRESFPQVLNKGTDTLIPGMAGYICSYDLFRRLSNINMFREAGVELVVLDECQAIKNQDSKRTQSVRQAIRDIPCIIPTSGTPWKNRGSEFYVVLNLLDPKLFYSFESFRRRHVATYWDGNKEKEGGIANPTEFKKLISHIAIRRERTEVMPELPTISRNKLIVEIPEYAKKVVRENEDELIKVYNQALIDGTEDSFETQQAIMQNLIIMRQVVGLAKVDSTCEFAQEFLEDTDRKLVIFFHHIECGNQMYARMKKWCMENNVPQPLALSAKLSSEERFEVAEKFNGPNYRLLLASTLASGEGLNLQTCSDCIIHERQWNPANEEQVEGRFIRIGQTANAVTATYVHGDESVDTDLDGIVEGKRREFNNSMNKDGYIHTWNEQSIVKSLAQAIANRRKKG